MLFRSVLSSISFHMASSHSGGAVFVKVMVFIAMLAAEVASDVRRVGDDDADMFILPECHPNPLPLESGTAARFRTENRASVCCRCRNAPWLPLFRGVFKLFFELDEVPLPVLRRIQSTLLRRQLSRVRRTQASLDNSELQNRCSTAELTRRRRVA